MHPLIKKGYFFVTEKIPFAITGLIATSINYGLYLLLVDRYLHYLPATIFAYTCATLANFVMQRYFVFDLNRSVQKAFLLSMMVSLGGMALDAGLVWLFHQIPGIMTREWLIKGLATFLIFFYNFYLKRMAFEGATREKRIEAVKDEHPDLLDG
ncbi:hypothetical protein CEQ90_04470 [Lewinellaceae bacterium SD302]|nr:hypothetical protein CEQ90_04470 [Lewinellaceae bacterium SD302]